MSRSEEAGHQPHDQDDEDDDDEDTFDAHGTSFGPPQRTGPTVNVGERR